MLDTSPLSGQEKTNAALTQQSVTQQPNNFLHVVPVPEGAGMPQGIALQSKSPSQLWPYHNGAGGVVGYVARYDLPEGKEYRPLSYMRDGETGRQSWRIKGFQEPRSLYKLPALLARPDAPVLIVEGEKTADAASYLFPDCAVTTSPHGSNSPHLAEWSVLAGRDVLIAADNDEGGLKYAQAVEQLAVEAGAETVRHMNLSSFHQVTVSNGELVERSVSLPEKWDLADALEEGFTPDLVASLEGLWLVPEVPDNLQAGKSAFIEEDGPFEHRLDGLYRKYEDETGACFRVSSPIKVLALTCNEDGEEWGLWVELTDVDGRAHRWAVPATALASASGDDVRRSILRLGGRVIPTRKAREALAEYLSTANPKKRMTCVSKVGWHDGAFILPDKTFGDSNAVLQTEGPFDHAFKVRGTLEGWQENIAQYAVGNSRLMFGISAAFAAPLLHLTSGESGGFHFRGGSSLGKTTTLTVAGSVCGGGEESGGYCSTWRATDNGLEGVARAHNDSLLCLDEMSQVPAKVAGETAYMLANGVGKTRANKAGDARKPMSWRVLFLSTGEVDLATQMNADGRQRSTNAGQSVRILDLPADAGAGFGIFENLHGFENGDVFSRHLKEAASKHYGHGLESFLQAVVKSPAEFGDAAREEVKGFVEDVRKQFGDKEIDGQITRAAARFGLVAVAGEIAAQIGAVPWEQGEAREAGLACFNAWIDSRGGVEPQEAEAAISKVRHFLEQHGASRFVRIYSDGSAAPGNPPRDRAGFVTTDGEAGDQFHILREVWKREVCDGLDPRFVARTLANHGMLQRGGKDRLTQRKNFPGVSRTYVYVVTGKVFGGGA